MAGGLCGFWCGGFVVSPAERRSAFCRVLRSRIGSSRTERLIRFSGVSLRRRNWCGRRCWRVIAWPSSNGFLRSAIAVARCCPDRRRLPMSANGGRFLLRHLVSWRRALVRSSRNSGLRFLAGIGVIVQIRESTHLYDSLERTGVGISVCSECLAPQGVRRAKWPEA